MKESDEVFLTERQKAFLDANPEGSLSSDASERRETPELKGVGGALLFLVVALTILGPLINALMTFSELQLAKEAIPAGGSREEWFVTQLVTWGLFAVYSAVSVTAGLLLLKRHKRSTILIVIGLIWLIGPILAFGVAFIVGDIVGGEGRSIVFSVVWTAYLLRSKRVKNTYMAEN